ncbi:site-specific integrase [Enterococcus faecalis]|uniref:tyrosine-type recombinase/integrase n=1 Tax=Enterococcus faecalis TaxID=1351 RepID=UPI0019F86818|nr:site-specific integrase [Enterococcus faecalis]EGO9358165.1 site-specific integrase [Enterococcus faecalis]EIW2089708.1 site-specific integrase [Enterococcus faecalis]QZT50116.1 site-specific integrase [Enterococcus faecalis]
MANKYKPTKYPGILSYETKRNGTMYRIRKSVTINGVKTPFDESKFKTLTAAKARLKEIDDLALRNETGILLNRKLTVNDYWEKYANKKVVQKVWSKDTRLGNDSLYKNHIKPKYGNLPLIQLNRNDYELYIVELLKKLRKDSVRSIHIAFMAMLNDAVYCGVIERNRLQRVYIGDAEKPARNKHLSLDEYWSWMDTAKRILTKYEYSCVYLCIYGMRRGEVCGITPKVISQNELTGNLMIHLEDSRTNATSKDGQSKGGVKTAESERYIALDELGTQALNTVLTEAREIKKDFGEILHRDDFIFINPRTAKPFHPTQLNRWFDRVSKECGIKATPHMLRHFFTTQAAIAGVPKEHVAAYLGHTDKVMTEKYTHLKYETAPNVVSAVSERLNKR